MQAVLAPPEQRAAQKKQMKSTIHRQKVRLHILYADFEDICGGDVPLAHALRIGEWQIDQRITALRAAHGIPESHMPHNDDLWLSMTYRMVESLTLRAVSKSTCERIFSEAEEDAGGMPSLIDLGFLYRRYIARPGGDGILTTRPAHATVYRDDQGDFIVIDENGEYIGDDNRRYSALSDGYTALSRQYLYDFEAVNAAIAEFDGLEAPEVLPRWEPTIAKWEPGGRRRQKRSASTTQETTKSPVDGATTKNKDRRKGTNQSESFNVSFEKQNITESGTMSRFGDDVPLDLLRIAPWCVETLLSLSSRFLAIPPMPDEDDDEALVLWQRDFGEPARRLFAATVSLSPLLAWERIDIATRYMATPGSPSWWQREPGDPSGQWRITKMPVTLKNVADRFIFEYDEYTKQRAWSCLEMTPYDGPPLESYEQGYGGAEPVVVEEVPQEDVENDGALSTVTVPIADELESQEPPSPEEFDEDNAPRQAFPMAPPDLAELALEITGEYPEAQLSTLAVSESKILLSIALGPEEYFDLDIVIWRVPLPSEEALIVQAMRYGALLNTAQSPPVTEEAVVPHEEVALIGEGEAT